MKNEKLIVFVVLIVVTALGISFYAILNDKKEKPVQTKNTNTTEKKETKKIKEDVIEPTIEEKEKQEEQEEISIDYKSLKKELIARIDNDPNTNAYLETCDNFERERTVLSTTSVEQLIDKLMTANSISKLPTSMTCPNYTYTVSTNIDNDMTRENIIIAMYSNDDNILLVGIKGEGYAFHFDTSLNGLLESLK